jgi:hypothetical protein
VGNVFRDEKAPYIIVLLIGIVGWMFNAALDTAKNLRVIEYRTVAGMDGAVNTVTFYVANRAMVSAINSGSFSFRCLPALGSSTPPAPCLAIMPSINANAQYLGSPGFGLPEPIPTEDEGGSVKALIPPKSEVGFKFGLASKDAKLGFSYVLSPDDIAGDKSSVQVRVLTTQPAESSTILGKLDRLTLFVIGNYFAVLVASMVALVLVLGLYVLVSFLVMLFGGRGELADGK